MEEIVDDCYQDNGRYLSAACGGPIFVSNHVGPMTSVPDFKASLLQELQDLEAELVFADDFSEELSIDDLKVFTEEELVGKALKEEFEYTSGNDESLQVLEQANSADDQVMNLNKEIISSSISENGSSNLESPTLLNDSSELICANDASEKIQQKGSKKRGRRFDRNTRAAELESCYVGRVKQLAKIKQRQDEDKLAARLHSFNGNSKSMEGTMVTFDKIEKMQSLKLMTSSLKVKASTSKVHKPVYYPEAILCVEIYHQNTLKKVQEFLVLESQNLSELRDNIYCLTDKLMLAAEKYDSSGYFLIEETFYNDLRSSAATDYSKPIFDWLENRSDEALKKWEFIMSGEPKKKQMELLGNLDFSNFPNFKASEMHKTTFCDLRFRLGAGYLYCHQVSVRAAAGVRFFFGGLYPTDWVVLRLYPSPAGNCKHTIVFRDLRLIHPDDSHNRADYPLLTFQIKPRKRKCSVCQIYQATKMTVEDKWAPDDPSYFCIKCYFLLHYKEDNTLLYPHTVYDYFHE